jgi:hypothetical protein
MNDDPRDRYEELLQRVDVLTRTVTRLEGELMARRREDTEPVSPSRSRRDLLKLAGGVATGALAAGVAASTAAARPAAASTGQNLMLGYTQYTANSTFIGNGGSTFQSLGTGLDTEPTMLWVDNFDASIDANGIRGDGHGVTGAGIWGHSDSNGIGVKGDGGIGVQAVGSRAALYLAGTNTTPLSRNDAHNVGEIEIDSAGNLWLCVHTGTPGTWRKLAGPVTAGSLHALSNPGRTYDSRWPGGTPIAAGASRLLSMADSHDITSGAVRITGMVPPGATAIAFNVSITDTTGAGFLSVAPGGASTILSSSINWSGPGQSIANGLIVGLDASRQVKVFAGGTGSTNFLIDVSGYFL